MMPTSGKLATIAMALVAAGALAISSPAPSRAVQTPASNSVAQGAGPPSGAVTFVDATFPSTSVGSDGRLTVTVFVSNTTESDATGVVALVLRSALGKAVTATIDKPRATIARGGRPVPITFTADLASQPVDAFPLSGWLVLESTATDTSQTALPAKTLLIPAVERRNDGAEWPLLYRSFWAAFIAVLLAVLFLVRRPEVFMFRMGSPTWSFTESWSSTLTIAGTILTGLLGFAGLPDYGHTMSRKTYGIASLLFSTLIMLAPGVYNLFRKTTQVKNEAGMLVPQTQGIVLFFLAAALLTTTGVLAQLKLLNALFSDLAGAAIISMTTASVFGFICLMLQFVLCVYAAASSAQTVKEQAEFQKAIKEGTQRQDAAGKRFEAALASPRLPDWPLL